jgi:hypothetical protein
MEAYWSFVYLLGRGCFWAVLISWLNQGSNEFSYCLRVETHILTFTSCLNVDISSYTCLFISCCINMSLTLMHLLGCLKHPLSMRVSFSCSPLPLPITTYSSIKLIASCSKVCARNVIYFLFSPIFYDYNVNVSFCHSINLTEQSSTVEHIPEETDSSTCVKIDNSKSSFCLCLFMSPTI